MGTLVQAPERAAATIGGLAPIEKPASGGGLGSFLEGILPAVNEVLDEHIKENKTHLRAVGQADKMNGMYREVSLIDRQSYAQGRNYQTLVNTQIALRQKLQEGIDNLDPTNPDPDVLLRMNEEHNKELMDNYHTSSVPNDLKELLYTNQLKEHALNIQAIDKKVKQLTVDNEYQTQMNTLAEYVHTMGNSEQTVEEMLLTTENFFASMAVSMKVADSEAKAEDIHKKIQTHFKTAMQHVLAPLEGTGEDVDVDRIEKLMAFVDGVEGIDLETATEVRKAGIKLVGEYKAVQSTMMERNLNAFITQASLNNTTSLETEFNEVANSILESDASEEDKTRFLQKLNVAWVSHQKELLSGTRVINPKGRTPSDVRREGGSVSQWEDDLITSYLQDYPEDSAVAYLAALYEFTQGAEASDEGARKASKGLAGVFMARVNMGDADVKADEYGAMREKRFQNFSKQYREHASQNGAKAALFISGIPEEYRDAFITAMKNNQSLDDIRINMRNSERTKVDYAHMDEAIGALTVENAGMDSKWFGVNASGTRSNAMSKHLRDNNLVLFKKATEESKHIAVLEMRGRSPEELVTIMQKYQIPSEKGYSQVNISIPAARVWGRLKNDDGSALNTRYMSMAIDAERERLAKVHNINAGDILVSVDSTGNRVTFDGYNTETNDLYGLRDGKGQLVNGGASSSDGISAGKLLVEARKLYNEDTRRKVKPTPNEQYRQKKARSIYTDNYVDTSTRKPVSLEVKAIAADSFKGNIAVTKQVLGHLAYWNGFRSSPELNVVRSKGDPALIYGIGISTRNADPATIKRLEAAKGNAQATMDETSAFMGQYFGRLDMDGAFKRVGLAPVNQGTIYNAAQMNSMVLLYDAAYKDYNKGLYGTTGKGGAKGMVAAMSAPTYAEGLKLLKQTILYDSTGRDSKRNKMYEEKLRKHYTSQGKK